jgi:raffinose/stachyose/melibiose transport system permease protein
MRRLGSKLPKKIIFIVGAVLSLAYAIPFFLVFVNAVKPYDEIVENPLAFPINFTWDNFTKALDMMGYWQALTNSLLITAFSVGALIVVSSMLAFYLQRNKNKFTKVTFLILVASMIVPFQALMIPFMALFAPYVSISPQASLIFFYMGFGVAMSTFLYHGFISNIPMELDEAAAIDGASDFTIFWRIIFPMLKPVTATVAIVNALWIWNDYLLPALVLTEETRTLPLSTYSFYNLYTVEYGYVMAGLLLAVVPIIAFYLVLQRQFISGISSGAVK